VVLGQITQEVKKLIDSLSEGRVGEYVQAHWSPPNERSGHDSLRLGQLLVQAKDKKFWPNALVKIVRHEAHTTQTAVYSIEEAMQALYTIKDSGNLLPTYGNGTTCRSCETTLSGLIDAIAEPIRKNANTLGLCLACCRSGDVVNICRECGQETENKDGNSGIERGT
jgi:hypothetical protein